MLTIRVHENNFHVLHYYHASCCHWSFTSIFLQPWFWLHWHDDVIKRKHFWGYWHYTELYFFLSTHEQIVQQTTRRRWLKTSSHSFWRHCNGFSIFLIFFSLSFEKSSPFYKLIRKKIKWLIMINLTFIRLLPCCFNAATHPFDYRLLRHEVK